MKLREMAKTVARMEAIQGTVSGFHSFTFCANYNGEVLLTVDEKDVLYNKILAVLQKEMKRLADEAGIVI